MCTACCMCRYTNKRGSLNQLGPVEQIKSSTLPLAQLCQVNQHVFPPGVRIKNATLMSRDCEVWRCRPVVRRCGTIRESEYRFVDRPMAWRLPVRRHAHKARGSKTNNLSSCPGLFQITLFQKTRLFDARTYIHGILVVLLLRDRARGQT